MNTHVQPYRTSPSEPATPFQNPHALLNQQHQKSDERGRMQRNTVIAELKGEASNHDALSFRVGMYV